MKLTSLLAISVLATVWISCVHEPFPAPPNGMANDTIKPPDTTQGPNLKPCDPDTVYFNRDVLPIFSSNCAFSGCHSSNSPKKGIILDNYQNIISTGKIKSGDVDAGKVFEVITETDPGDRMPPSPRNALSQSDIDLIEKWILQGAKNLTCDECDTANISYQMHIKPIFDKSCAVCHSGASPSGGLMLTDYLNTREAVIFSQVVPRINHRNGLPVMPPSGIKLDECKLHQIDAWVKAGYPNN